MSNIEISQWETFEYKGVKIERRLDSKVWRATDFGKATGMEVLVAGGANERPIYNKHYCEQAIDLLINDWQRTLNQKGIE